VIALKRLGPTSGETIEGLLPGIPGLQQNPYFHLVGDPFTNRDFDQQGMAGSTGG
jgi:hypothetical protein